MTGIAASIRDTTISSSSRMAPQPAPDCRLFVLDDAGIVFCAGQQALYALNTSATLAWLGMEEGDDEAGIAASLAQVFSHPLEQSALELAALMQYWRDLGLLAGSEDRRRPVERPSYATGPLPQPPTSIARCSERHYRLLDTHFAVVFSAPEQAAVVHPLLAHLESAALDGRETALAIAATADGFLILRDGEVEHLSSALGGLGPAVKACLLRHALEHHEHLLDLHAGVVERDGCALLLPAAAGRGKTTLVAGLIRAGWRYLSDETAPLSVGSLRVRPVPLALAVKPGSWPVLQRYYGEIEGLPTYLREDMKRVRYLPPQPEQMAPDRVDGYPVKWVIFPRYQPSARSELRPLSKVELVQLLFTSALSLPRTLDNAAATELVGWVSGLEGYELVSSSLEEGVALLNGLH